MRQDASKPCNAPLLFQRPERRYPYFLPASPVAQECLLVPFHVNGNAVGTIWLIAHDDRRELDAEDLRQLQSLARFASAAYQAVRSQDAALERGTVELGLKEQARQANTGRRQVEEAVRESEAINRSVVESSPDCIKILSLDGALLIMLSGAEILGIDDIGPFLNQPWLDFWHGKDRLAARATVAAAAAGGMGEFVGFFPMPEGEDRWWNVRVSPILDAKGLPGRLLAVSRNVTEQRRREMNLEFLASFSHDLMHWTNAQEMMQTVGAKVGAHLQLSLCAFVEIDEAAAQVVIDHEWHRQDVPGLQGTHRLSDFVEGEFIRLARAGEIIVVRDVVADPRTDPEKFASLQIASFLCVPLVREGQWRFALCLYKSEAYDWREDQIDLVRELTARIWTRLERLKAEEALRRSEKRFRALFAWGPIAMYSCDSAGVIQDYNQGAVKLWEREPQPGETDEQFRSSFKTWLPDGSSWPYAKAAITRMSHDEPTVLHDVEVVVERPDGSRITVEVNVVPLKDDAGTVTGEITCFYDITERSRLAQKLQEHAQVLTDMDRRKDEFLAMLSHELRNPLAPLTNAVHMLRLLKNEDPIQRQARTIIERQVGQLKHLVGDLLEISRVTTGRVELRRERIARSGIVERAIETAQPMIEQRRHELTVSQPPQPVWLQADAARLEQVLVNLLTNAAKYTDEGGHIWVTVQQEGDEAVLRIRDTGIGIAAELLPRIFELFTQAERSLDRSQGGAWHRPVPGAAPGRSAWRNRGGLQRPGTRQ